MQEEWVEWFVGLCVAERKQTCVNVMYARSQRALAQGLVDLVHARLEGKARATTFDWPEGCITVNVTRT